MTLHLIPSTRRQCLQSTLSVGISTLACHSATAAPSIASNRWALLADTQPHVQAYIYRHTHDWKLSKTVGQVHLINQPPCAYVFNESRPKGWVRMTLSEDEFTVELRALDKSHPQHGEKHVLQHRFATVK